MSDIDTGTKMTSDDMKQLMDEMKSIKESMEFMNVKFESVLKELKDARVENEQYKKKVDALSGKVEFLEMQVCELKNEQLQENLEICGLPCKSDENCHMVAYNVFKQVHPEIKQEDIVEAYRMGSVNDREGKPRMFRNVLVKLKGKKMRNLIFKNKKKLKGINTVSLGLSSENRRLYINENLSRESRALFSKTNALRKEKGWRYIWTDFGNILVRQSEDSRVLKIRSERDLSVF